MCKYLDWYELRLLTLLGCTYTDLDDQLRTKKEEHAKTSAFLQSASDMLEEANKTIAKYERDVTSERTARNELAVDADSTRKSLAAQLSTTGPLNSCVYASLGWHAVTFPVCWTRVYEYSCSCKC